MEMFQHGESSHLKRGGKEEIETITHAN